MARRLTCPVCYEGPPDEEREPQPRSLFSMVMCVTVSKDRLMPSPSAANAFFFFFFLTNCSASLLHAIHRNALTKINTTRWWTKHHGWFQTMNSFSNQFCIARGAAKGGGENTCFVFFFPLTRNRFL